MRRVEAECEETFRKMGSVYNANTPENHPDIFLTPEDFKAAMSILAISARMFDNVRVYAFQIMSNHIHLVIGGDDGMIREFFAFFVGRLGKFFRHGVDLEGFKLKLFPVRDLSYFRNAIAYVNRNGFVVNDDVTPFSYPWGSSPYFFHPMFCRLVELHGVPIGNTALRQLVHSKKCDGLRFLSMVDGYVSPLEFCDVVTAEKTFGSARQYFYGISRNVESYSMVARSIGECVFYSDNDLFFAAVKLAKSRFDSSDLRTLPSSAKLDLARELHYEYNAGDKQLQRLLKLDAAVLRSLF